MPRRTKAEEAASPLIDLACACASARRTARLVTQLYALEMGPLIEPAQFALLFALDQYPGRPQMVLGRALGLDKTTLSRNLRLLERNGWIEAAAADDERERGHRLTDSGKETLASAKPGWKTGAGQATSRNESRRLEDDDEHVWPCRQSRPGSPSQIQVNHG